jgi:glycosyltransferase XagB
MKHAGRDDEASVFDPEWGAALSSRQWLGYELGALPYLVRRPPDPAGLARTERSLRDATPAEVHRDAGLPLRTMIGSRSIMESPRQHAYARLGIERATKDLVTRTPEESAYRVLTRRQQTGLLTLLFFGIAGLIYHPVAAIVVFNVLTMVFYLSFSAYKFKTILSASRENLEFPVDTDALAEIKSSELPVYTILIPLYREAAVLSRLVKSIERIDYPRERLDVKLLLEEDDAETIQRARTMDLPAHLRIVTVPDGLPKTKPRACNYGLIQAEGEFVVIYDAEDRPDPDQLKKAVIAFDKAGPGICCVQCKLNYFNRDQNLLTRWFTNEYSMWFDLFMPGLAAAGAPLPLGGTSNHFITKTLVELGAWDPFNVTEDADLGIRLHKRGFKTVMVDSTTYEEANSQLGNWIRQRSRWIKGYIQTWLVHMRHPILLGRQMGWKSWFSFQMVVGGTFGGFLLNPIYWLLTVLWILSQVGVIRQLFPGFIYFLATAGLYLGNFAFMYANILGALHRGYFALVKYALLSPLYWVLMSIGAWKGLLQLFFKPFYWEKTLHGLDCGSGRAILAHPAVSRVPSAEEL